MKKTLTLLVTVASLAGVLFLTGCGNSSPTKPSNNGGGGGGHQVAISGFAFSSMTVPVGTTVTWKNNDNVPHTATSDTGSAFQFDTGTIAAGGTSAGITFTQQGTFPYHCTVHPSMHGSITVQ